MSKVAYVTAPRFLDRKVTDEISSCSGILSELPLFSPYFSIKSEFRNTSAFDFFLLQNTVGIENVPLSRVAMRYYRVSVTRELKLETFSGRLLYIMLAFFRAF